MNENLTIRTKKSCDIPKKQAKKIGGCPRAHSKKTRPDGRVFRCVLGEFPGNARRAQAQARGAGIGAGAGTGAGRGARTQARGAERRRGHRRGRGQGHGRGRFYAKTGAHKKSRAAALFVCPAKRPRALSGHKKKNKTARRITPQARGIPKRHSSVAPLPRSRRAVRRRRRQALRAGRRCFPKRGPGPGTVPRAGRRRGRTRRGALSPPARACAAQAAPTVWARAGRATAWPPQSSRFPRR